MILSGGILVEDLKKLEKKYELVWDKYGKEDLDKAFELSDRYIDFMSKCKTERECVTEFIELAEKDGYVDINQCIAEGRNLNQEIKFMLIAWEKLLHYS